MKIWLVLFMLLLAPFTACNAAEVPALNARVTDLTGTLDAGQITNLDLVLAIHEEKTTNQIAVLMIPSTGEESIEQYATRVFEQWKLGQKGKDNGVLFVIAKNDRKMRIEVGYGLEGVIPDVVAARIIDQGVVPLFRDGNYAAGISEGVTRLVAAANGELPDWEAQVQTSSGSRVATPAEVKVILVWPSLVILTFILIFSGQAIEGRKGSIMTSFGLACFFGTFIAAGMMAFSLNGSWPGMKWWWQYLPALGLGLFFTIIRADLQMFSAGSGGSSSGSSSGFSGSSSSGGGSSSGGSSFSGGGGSSGGGGASGSW